MNTALSLPQSELTERVAHVVGTNIFDVIANVHRLSVEYATMKAAVEQMDWTRKSLRASLHEDHRKRLRDMGEKTTESQLENLALMDDHYIDYCEQITEAKKQLADVAALYYAARNTLTAMEQLNQIYKQELYSNR